VTESSRHSAGNGLVHLSDAEIAGYLDRDLSPEERRRVETHVDECAACRGELVSVSRITQPVPVSHGVVVTGKKRWWLPAAAAAAVVAALALPNLTSNPRGPDTALRSRRIPDGTSGSRFAVVAPADDTTVGSAALVFTWHAAAAADVYHFDLTTDSGDPVWTKDTGDTSVALPDSVPLQSGRAYFWSVEAIGNGISATTNMHRLRIARR
jgi:putative zinc finger protein